MATKLSPKQYVERSQRLSGGHRLCAGCGAGIIVRQLLMGAKDNPVVVSNATGCLEVSTTIYPYTAWKDSFIHSAFENAAATISGVEAAYKSLSRQGRVDSDKPYKFLSIGGDGGSYDIGLQAISGALERGHDIVIACYDNGAYMNTGIQRSSATPFGAMTTTSPPGKLSFGQSTWKKDMVAIAVAHGIPYVATASPGYLFDLYFKVKKAVETPGPAYINILSVCPTGWRCATDLSVRLARLAWSRLSSVKPLREYNVICSGCHGTDRLPSFASNSRGLLGDSLLQAFPLDAGSVYRSA